MPDSARSVRSQLSTPRSTIRGGAGTGGLQILIDQSKQEEFTTVSGLRLLHKHLIRSAWNVEINNSELSGPVLERCRLLVLPRPMMGFYQEELDSLRAYIRDKGGSLLVMLAEGRMGGEQQASSNIGTLLEEFGITGNRDSVIRTIFYKYFDPKEALIPNGIVNRALVPNAGAPVTMPTLKGSARNDPTATTRPQLAAGGRDAYMNGMPNEENNFQSAFTFVYPYGCTLNVEKPAAPILSTGTVCYPVNRPICAFFKTESGGRLAVIGSVQMFSDEYLEKEENLKIFDALLKLLIDTSAELNTIDSSDPDIADAHTLPDHLVLMQSLKMCLQESEVEQASIGDFIKLLDSTLHSIGLEHWPEAIRDYEQLGMKHEPLTLVPPLFEIPQPPLEPATFPPSFLEIPSPQLELFDLEDAFTSTEQRLAQLTNRCTEPELEAYIHEAGGLLGINLGNMETLSRERAAKRILERILVEIVHYKSSGMDDTDMPTIPYNFQAAVGGTAHRAMNHHSLMGPPGAASENDANYFSDIDEYDDMDIE